MKRASRAILVRIVAFAKATPEEHLAPESLLLLGRAILGDRQAESYRESLRTKRGGQTQSRIHASDSAQNQPRIVAESKAESLSVTAPIENPFGPKWGGQTKTRLYALEFVQNQSSIQAESKAESSTLISPNDPLIAVMSYAAILMRF